MPRPRLGHHVDGMTRALFEARGAPGAEVELDPIEPALPQLDDRLLGARGVAVVALETIAAGEAPCRLVSRFSFREAGDDFVEACALRDRQFGMLTTLGVEEHGEVQQLVRHRRMLRRLLVNAATQPRVDVARRLLAVADRRRHGPRAADHVAAGEDAVRSRACARPLRRRCRGRCGCPAPSSGTRRRHAVRRPAPANRS